MKIKKQKVLDALKVKAYSLGFSEDELGKVADKIVNDNEVPDDADDAKITEVVNNAINSAMDYLSLAQSASQRTISKIKKKLEEDDKKKDVPKPVEEPGQKTKPSPKGNDDDLKSFMSTMLKKLEDFEAKTNERFDKINSANVAQTRLDRLRAVIKDSGNFGEMALRNFNRMNFADEDDFNSYLKDMQEGAEKYITDTSQDSLKGTPPKNNPRKDDVKVATDEECEAIASHII